MAEFHVQLVGGPLDGPRVLRSPRRRPPTQLPVLHHDPSTADPAGADRGGPGRRLVSIYRYSHHEPEGRYVYAFVGERVTTDR
jgi:hypothetical protein